VVKNSVPSLSKSVFIRGQNGPLEGIDPPEFFVYFLCMAFKTLTISEEAHRRLKKHKLPGESFTQVILRELPEPLETAGEVLDFLKSEPPPRLDRNVLNALRKGRGRRSNRK
jgi:predicted CopG family antitoxin